MTSTKSCEMFTKKSEFNIFWDVHEVKITLNDDIVKNYYRIHSL